MLSIGLSALGDDGPVYRDVYLTENRICKACTGRWLNDHEVELSNRKGEVTVVPSQAIIGIDNHPLARKTFLKSLHGIGLPAKVIVPYAFPDAKDFVCKYCDP